MRYKRNKVSSRYTSASDKRKGAKKNILHKIPSYVIMITLILFCILKIAQKGSLPLMSTFKGTGAGAVAEKVQKISESAESYISALGEKGAEFVFGYLKSDNTKDDKKVFAEMPDEEKENKVSSDATVFSSAQSDVFSPALPCIGRVSSPFGKREHPVSGQSAFHNGVDIAVDAGTPIKAIEKGTVEKSTYNQYSGNFIVISHQDGYISSYAHLGESSVSEGQSVKKGDIIGLAGSTGVSTGPHLHMEIKKDGELIDPMGLIEG